MSASKIDMGITMSRAGKVLKAINHFRSYNGFLHNSHYGQHNRRNFIKASIVHISRDGHIYIEMHATIIHYFISSVSADDY